MYSAPDQHDEAIVGMEHTETSGHGVARQRKHTLYPEEYHQKSPAILQFQRENCRQNRLNVFFMFSVTKIHRLSSGLFMPGSRIGEGRYELQQPSNWPAAEVLHNPSRTRVSKAKPANEIFSTIQCRLGLK